MTNQQPITDVLRDAVNASGLPFLALEKATGVLRQSLMKFARGSLASTPMPPTSWRFTSGWNSDR